MTDPISKKQRTLAGMILEYLPLSGLVSGLLFIFLAGLFALFGDRMRTFAGVPSSEDIAALRVSIEDFREAADSRIAAMQGETAAIERRLVEMQRQIALAARPERIVIYRETPRTAEDSCFAGEDCTIVVFAERDQLATACEIIPGMSELILTVDGRVYKGQQSDPKRVTNLTATPLALEPTFRLPMSISPGAHAGYIRTFYTDCPWQIDGQPPAFADSPTFTVEIAP
jgi:hypothetical protein